MDKKNNIIVPKTKEESIKACIAAHEIGTRYVKEALSDLDALKDVYLSNGLGDEYYEHIDQGKMLINRSAKGHIWEDFIPKNAIEYNMMIERQTRDFEEFLGQFVPSVFNYMRRMLVHVEEDLAKSEGKDEKFRSLKKTLDDLIRLASEFVEERREKLLIADY